MCRNVQSFRISKCVWSKRQFRASSDSMVCPSWCNHIWCIHEYLGTTVTIRMAMVCNDLYAHSICQCFSTAMAIVMCPTVIISRTLSIGPFHWLVIRPNRQLALLWFSSPSSSFLYEFLELKKKTMFWIWIMWEIAGFSPLKLLKSISYNSKLFFSVQAKKMMLSYR